MSNSRLVNAPTELKLGDRTFLMSALTDMDEAALDEYVQAKVIENARKSLPDNVSEREFERLMSIAMRASLSVAWSRPPGSRIFATTMGLARLVWQGVKRNQKDVTVEDIHKYMFDAKNVFEAHQQFRKVNEPPVLANREDVVKGNGDADATSFQNTTSTTPLSA